MNTRRLFLVIVGFCVVLSLHYFSLTRSSEILPNQPHSDKVILTDSQSLDLQEKARLEAKIWKEKAQAEKPILEARIRKDYENRTPLPFPYITHTFDENGNITKPIKKPYLFLHVAKTAGSTLSSVFKRSERPSKFSHTWAHPKLQDMPKMATKDIVFGHFRYGLHYYFNRTCTYMTVLRDPIDRVVSHYYYHIQHKKDPGHLFAMNRTFEEWIRDSPAANNEQTRVLSGMRSEFNISERTLDMAMYHMRTFAVVGLTEKYHETLMLLKHIAGLTVTRYRPINKGVKRPKLADVPPETVELIKKHNWADIELYKLAKEIFEKQIEQMPDKYFADLEEFERVMSKKKPSTITRPKLRQISNETTTKTSTDSVKELG
eukprot:Phypoly_transcript_05475.p1 GENE.Phypoly_transcript_05475~~Phypoly_transcript_05475.p1  ORF type:complete len:375 (+),score=19.68 Phypoly_transcript_05475:39-1163(+)